MTKLCIDLYLVFSCDQNTKSCCRNLLAIWVLKRFVLPLILSMMRRNLLAIWVLKLASNTLYTISFMSRNLLAIWVLKRQVAGNRASVRESQPARYMGIETIFPLPLGGERGGSQPARYMGIETLPQVATIGVSMSQPARYMGIETCFIQSVDVKCAVQSQPARYMGIETSFAVRANNAPSSQPARYMGIETRNTNCSPSVSVSQPARYMGIETCTGRTALRCKAGRRNLLAIWVLKHLISPALSISFNVATCSLYGY